jgi:iron complex outermembrane receptor protein
MKMVNRSLLLSTALASVWSFCGVVSTAHAQDQGWGVTEVVVTAQKREQRLQDVPASVTAITGENLQVNRIQNVQDLDSVSPNLTITNIPAGNSSPVYSMRGVIGLGTAAGADKGVALYIDGVYIGTASGSAFDLADIERVEVLKGPQGTLFGRNSTGGAVSITTRGPRGEFHVKQEVTVGNYDQIQTRTRVDTPQIGPLSAAVTYAHSQRRGEIRNTGYGTIWNGTRDGLSSTLVAAKYLGSDDTDSWAASVRYDAGANFDLEYKFDHTHDDFTELGVGELGLLLPTIVAFNNQSGSPLVISPTRPNAVNNWATVPSTVSATGHVLTANWRLNESITLKNIVAYRKSSYFGPLNDLYGTGGLSAVSTAIATVPFFSVVTLSAGHDSQWTEEFQGDYDSKLLHLTTGGLWFHQKNSKGQAGTGYNSISFQAAPGFILPAPATATQQSDVTVRSYAAYAQGEFHVMDKLDAIAGARYTDDKKRGVDRTTPLGGDLNYDGNKWTYNLGLNYKPTGDILLYGKYSTGYISGGKLATLTYNPEVAKSLEGGLKADWLNRRLRTNLALYSAKYGNLQVAGSGLTFGVPAAAQVLINAGDATAKGFELETTAVPIRDVTLGANLGYLDFKYTRLDPRFAAAGNTIPTQRPKWTANLSAQYVTIPVVGDARITLRADANYRSAHDGGSIAAYRALTQIPKSWVINTRVSLDGFSLGGADASLAIWARNLTNEDGPRYILGPPVVAAASYERARTFGVDLTVEF